MSLTSKNQLLIAFKKLVGKAHTNAQFGSANESVASNVQLDNSTIFAQPIPSAPNTTLYSITNNIVERVQFSLVSISLSQYTAVGAAGGGITADGDGAPTQGTFTNGIHAYALTLPSNYTTLSSNPKKGTGVFINGQSLTGSNGVLQVVPERYGASYPAQVSSSSGILAALDEEDYLLDPYSGILFLQDINRVPTSVTAYIYIGDYLNQTVSGSTAQFTTISASIVSASQYVGLPSFSAIPGGTDQTVQFNSGSTFSGSNQLTYNYNTNILSGTIARFSVVTSSFTGSGAGLFNLTASGISNFTNDVRGQFSAGTNITIVGGVISSTGGGGGTPGGTDQTLQFNSGSTFSGSTNLVFDYTNNILSGTVARFTTVTASLIGTASFATNAGNANTVTNGVYTNTNNTFTAVNTFSNFYITGSITGSDAKFISITGSHAGSGAGLTNIPNAALVNSSVTVGSTNIALGGTATTLQGITVLTGSTITGSIALFSQITGAFSGSGRNVTNITASNISNFTNDVRSQFSAGTNITIVGGVISSTGGGGGGTPGGTDQTLQFNSGSTFSGSTNLVYNYTTNTLSGTIAQFSQITASSIRTAFITSSNIDTDYIDFNGINGEAPWQTGRLYYNTASNLLSLYTEVPNLNVHLGEQLIVRVQNDLPITLTKGKVIQITGSTSSDVPRVITASWDNDATSARSLAVVMADIAVGARGYVLLSGLFEGLNTDAYEPGQMLYLSSSGNITNVIPPAPLHEVRIGQVVRKQTVNGSIFVRIQNGYELEELHDVDILNAQNGDLLTYQTSPYNQWVNSKTLSGSYNITNALTASSISVTTISASQYIGITGGGGGTPGGTDQTLQFNSGSTFSGSTNLVYNYGTNVLSGTTAQFSVITSSFTGSGAGLYDITASGITNFTNDVRSQFSAGANITINAGVISATTGSVIGSVITVTGNYIVLTTDDRIFTDGTLTLTLPSAVGSSGKSYYIKNIGTGSVTVTGTLGQKIDGYDNMIITEQNSAFGLLSNNVGWYIF